MYPFKCKHPWIKTYARYARGESEKSDAFLVTLLIWSTISPEFFERGNERISVGVFFFRYVAFKSRIRFSPTKTTESAYDPQRIFSLITENATRGRELRVAFFSEKVSIV